jgi:hypothetical protein
MLFRALGVVCHGDIHTVHPSILIFARRIGFAVVIHGSNPMWGPRAKAQLNRVRYWSPPTATVADGQWMTNSHQGHFPDHDTGCRALRRKSASAVSGKRLRTLRRGWNVWQWVSDKKTVGFVELLRDGRLLEVLPRATKGTVDRSDVLVHDCRLSLRANFPAA